MKTILFTLMIKIWFIDPQTNDTLPGVKITTDKQIYYSNLDGYVDIPNNEKVVKINHNSYKTIDDIKVTSDTIIFLTQ